MMNLTSTSMANHTDIQERTAFHLAAGYGSFYIINKFFKNRLSINAVDKLFEWSPIGYAVAGRQWDTVEELLDAGAKAYDMIDAMKKYENYVVHAKEGFRKTKTTLLHVAAERVLTKFLNFLIENRKDLINIFDESGCTPLHISKNMKVIKLLLAGRAKINAKNKYGQTLLHFVVVDRSYEFEGTKVIEHLIKYGANIEEKDDMGNTPLSLAVRHKNRKIVTILLKRGAEVDYEGNYLDDLLWLGLEDEYVNATIIILQKYVNSCRSFNKDIYQPFTEAQYNIKLLRTETNAKNAADYLSRHSKGVDSKNLIKQKCDIDAKVKLGDYNKNEILLTQEANVKIKYWDFLPQLHQATFIGNVGAVKHLIEKEGADVNSIEDKLGFTPLFIAIINGNKDIAECLIAKGANVNATDKIGCVPLHYSVIQGNEEISKLLIEQKSSFEIQGKNSCIPTNSSSSSFSKCERGKKGFTKVEVKEKHGCTPMHLAAFKGNGELCKLLIKHQADVEAKNNKFWTPLYCSVLENRCSISEILLANDANINNVNEVFVVSILHYAVIQNNIESVEFLLKRGANVDSRSFDGFTPLHFASFLISKDIMEILLKLGANIEAKDTLIGCTPLHLAVCFGCKEVVKFLIDQGADIEAKDDTSGFSPLHFAAYCGNKVFTELLIKQGAKVEATTHGGETPLHIASLKGNKDVIDTLMVQGRANFEPENGWGFTPLTLATAKGQEEVKKFLQEWGAKEQSNNKLVSHLFSLLNLKLLT